jgi:hypothetical protein
MTNEMKVTVSIYCKIFTENYPLLEGEVTGDQIVNHLLSDCGCVWEEDDSPEGAHQIPGDLNIWYLGTNEKFGEIHLVIDETLSLWEWRSGEADFQNVIEFIETLRMHEVITSAQHKQLEEAIEIGKTIGDMYEIGNYLKRKREGKEVRPSWPMN